MGDVCCNCILHLLDPSFQCWKAVLAILVLYYFLLNPISLYAYINDALKTININSWVPRFQHRNLHYFFQLNRASLCSKRKWKRKDENVKNTLVALDRKKLFILQANVFVVSIWLLLLSISSLSQAAQKVINNVEFFQSFLCALFKLRFESNLGCINRKRKYLNFVLWRFLGCITIRDCMFEIQTYIFDSQ